MLKSFLAKIRERRDMRERLAYERHLDRLRKTDPDQYAVILRLNQMRKEYAHG